MSSEEEEALLLLALAEDERQIRKKRKWIHDINLERHEFGEYHTLMPKLRKDVKRFFTYFRMMPEEFDEILNLIKSDIHKNDTNYREAIPPEERLAVTLRFLATGDSYSTIGHSFRMGFSTVAAIVYETCEAICNKMQNVCMPEPTEEIWKKSAELFETKWKFPNCIGSIDGKHVTIKCPNKSGSNYYCYLKKFSIVLMAIVGADYKFICVDIGGYGKNSDSGIFEASNMGRRFEDGTMNIPNGKVLEGQNDSCPYVLIGDEGFALKPYLMRPFPYRQSRRVPQKENFNTRLCKARRVVENAFVVAVVILLVSPILQAHGRVGDRRLIRQLPPVGTLPPPDPCLPFYNDTNNQFTSPACSPDDTTYPSNINCVRVLTAPPQHLIKLDFRDYFQIEPSLNCMNDFLEIRDGRHGYNKIMEHRFCGIDAYPPLITSSDRHLWIRFKSDDNIEYRGFKAIYEFIPRPPSLTTPEIIPCYINVTDQYEGIISRANISEEITKFNTENDLPIDCLYTVTVEEKWGIYLQFDRFGLDRPNDCDSNFVQVFSNNTDIEYLKMFCGSIADAVSSESNKMFVRFYSVSKGPKTEFAANFTAYRKVVTSSNTVSEKDNKCGTDEQIYCEDETCIVASLKCNGKFNCRTRFDEDGCDGYSESPLTGENIIIIMVIFTLILVGMCITFIYNCTTKLIRDHQTIQEYMRQSEQQLNELDKHGHEKKSSSKIGSQSRSRSSPSMDSNRFDAANAINTPCYVPGGDILPILVRSEHSVSPSNGDAYNTNIYTVDNDNPPEMCDSACQTRESLFITQGYSSENSSPAHSVHTNSPPAPFSTFGYQKENKFKAEAKIEMMPQQTRIKNKYEKGRPYSVQTTKSAPDVIVTH